MTFMVNYKPHTLIAFGGRLAKGLGATTTYVDVWSCSIRGGTVGGSNGPVSDPIAALAAVQAPLKTWFQTANWMSSLATLEWVKLNNIGADGKYSSPGPTNVYTYPTAGVGGQAVSTSSYPMFVTIAATYLTTKARGRASRGRISLPWGIFTADGSSFPTSTQKTAVGAAAAALPDTLHTAIGTTTTTWQAMVYSSIDGSAASIQTVRIGSRFDTINRRKNAIPEAPYNTAPLLNPGPV